MRAALDALLKSAKAGHREDALSLWKKATRAKDVDFVISASSILGYEDELYEWSYALWKGKKTKPLSSLLGYWGFDSSEDLLEELRAALKVANGSRRSASFQFKEILSLLQDLQEHPDKLSITFSNIGSNGMSLFVGLCEDDVIKFVLAPIECRWGNEVEHDISRDFFFWAGHKPADFYEALENITLANCFPGVFQGWTEWEENERREAVEAWMEEEATPTIAIPLAPIRFPSAEVTEPIHAASDILPGDENRVFNEILKLFDRDLGENEPTRCWRRENYERREVWEGLHELIESLTAPMGEVGLTLISRALSGWHDEFLNGHKGLMSKETKFPEVWSRLSHSFVFEADEGDGKLTKYQIKRIQEGMLRNARTLIFDCPFAMRCDLLRLLVECPSAVQRLEWYNQKTYGQDEWAEIVAHPVWEGLTHLHWSALSMFDTLPDFDDIVVSLGRSDELLHLDPNAGNEMAHIKASSSQMNQLKLYSVQIDEQIATSILALSELQKLVLAGCEFTVEAEALFAHQFPPKLDTLQLYCCEAQKFGEHVSHEPLKDATLLRVPNDVLKGLWVQSLEELEWLSNEIFEDASGYRPLPALRKLTVGMTDNPDESWNALLAGALFPNLEILHANVLPGSCRTYAFTNTPEPYVSSIIKNILKATEFPKLRTLAFAWLNYADGLQKKPFKKVVDAVVSCKLSPSLKEFEFPIPPQYRVIDRACGASIANWKSLQELERFRMTEGHGVIQKSAKNAVMKSKYIHDGLTIEWM